MIALDTITCMDALAFARTLPDNSVHCVVTSPPYYGLRDYGIEGQIGLEDTPQAWLARMVELFREIRRVLREDGTCWVNMGDSYGSAGGDTHSGFNARYFGKEFETDKQGSTPFPSNGHTTGLRPKNLLMMPARLAIALQEDGFYLRSEIVWAKPNPMPESTRDRPTKAHEMVYLLTKAPRYWYDQEAIREPADWGRRNVESAKPMDGRNAESSSLWRFAGDRNTPVARGREEHGVTYDQSAGRNKRTVWTVATEPTQFAHFATFPQALIEPMILAGCPARVCSVCGAPWVREMETVRESSWERRKADGIVPGSQTISLAQQKQGSLSDDADRAAGGFGVPALRVTNGFRPTCDHDAPTDAGICYDPFMGAGTTGLVAMRLGRHYIGSELNPEYVALARERIAQADPYQPKAYEDGVTQLSLFAQEDET